MTRAIAIWALVDEVIGARSVSYISPLLVIGADFLLPRQRGHQSPSPSSCGTHRTDEGALVVFASAPGGAWTLVMEACVVGLRTDVACEATCWLVAVTSPFPSWNISEKCRRRVCCPSYLRGRPRASNLQSSRYPRKHCDRPTTPVTAISNVSYQDLIPSSSCGRCLTSFAIG